MVDYNLSMMRFHRIEHTADEGIEWSAESLEGLFETGAGAFAELVAGEAGEPEEDLERTVEVAGTDLPDLMVRFLHELLFLFETRSEIYPAVEVRQVEARSGGNEARLTATLKGRRFDAVKEEGGLVIKAVTYHGLLVERETDRTWRARVLFDV